MKEELRILNYIESWEVLISEMNIVDNFKDWLDELLPDYNRGINLEEIKMVEQIEKLEKEIKV